MTTPHPRLNPAPSGGRSPRNPLSILAVVALFSSVAPPASAQEPLPSTSIYHLSSVWQQPDGSSMTLKALRGRPVAMAMIYSTCKHTCPRIIADLRRLRGLLGEDAGRVHFVLVSLDPARDTPERLRAFAAETGLDALGFTLLRGDGADVRDLASVLDVRYEPMGKTDIAHANVLTILDEQGVIVHQARGTGAALDDVAAALRARLSRTPAAQGVPRTSAPTR